jgi:hypothetical protein
MNEPEIVDSQQLFVLVQTFVTIAQIYLSAPLVNIMKQLGFIVKGALTKMEAELLAT